jgi:hypothetical protein
MMDDEITQQLSLLGGSEAVGLMELMDGFGRKSLLLYCSSTVSSTAAVLSARLQQYISSQ